MRTTVILSLTVLFTSVAIIHAQQVALNTLPRTQTESAQGTTYTVTPTVTGGFNATIFFRASSATLIGASFTFAPPTINAPYSKSTQLTVIATGAKQGGDHKIIIEGYNGPMVVRDTVILTITDRPAWTVYDASNSPLPEEAVRCIAIDKNGVGWIGTNNGLARFDRAAWTIYNKENTPFTNNGINCLAVDTANNVWVGTKSGLYVLRSGVWSGQAPQGSGANSDGISSLAASNDGAMWMVRDGGIVHFDGVTWTGYNPSNSPLLKDPDMVAVSGDNSIWMVNESSGVDRFDGTYWTHYSSADLVPNGFSIRFNRITRDLNGNIWTLGRQGAVKFVGADYTVFYRDEHSGASNAFPGPEPNAMTFDASTTIWAGSNWGLSRYLGKEQWLYTVGNSGLPSSKILSLQADGLNTIWIGTDKGLALLDGNAAPLKGFTTSVEEDTVVPVATIITSVAPHPVSGVSSIHLNLITDTHVRMVLHNSRGAEVAVLCDMLIDRGERQVQFDATGIAVGAYVLRLVAGDIVESRALIVSR